MKEKKEESQSRVALGTIQEISRRITGLHRLKIFLTDGTGRIVRYETKQEFAENQAPRESTVAIDYSENLLSPKKITVIETGLVFYGEHVTQAACPYFPPVQLNQYEE